MELIVLKGKYSIFRFSDKAPLPDWIYWSEFYAITKTSDELSVVASQPQNDPENTVANKDWKILKISGPLDLSLVGIISEISAILKDAKIPIFTISTFDTDYILVKEADINDAVPALQKMSHTVKYEEESYSLES
jgi:uncharacterized protein